LALLKKEGRRSASAAHCEAERERQGLSLADHSERNRIDRAALSRPKNNEEANPTLTDLERYAKASPPDGVLLSEAAAEEVSSAKRKVFTVTCRE